MSQQQLYWLQILAGFAVVSLPFFYAAIKKKITWPVFFTWMSASLFSTIAVVALKANFEKTLGPKTFFIVSLVTGFLFIAAGIYLQSLPSDTCKKIGWMFIIFGISWNLLSL